MGGQQERGLSVVDVVKWYPDPPLVSKDLFPQLLEILPVPKGDAWPKESPCSRLYPPSGGSHVKYLKHIKT